tara:strand:- start:309 stop:656 length:348 start_codon:yes stop_codon:yes gene_type:complete
MSRIIIMSADPSAPGAKAVSALRKVNPMSISAARRALSGAEPLVDSVVFENDHERVAALIRSVCRSLREMERPFRIYELAPDEGWANLDEALKEKLELTPSALENILARVASERV